MEESGNKAIIKIYVTSVYKSARVKVYAHKNVIASFLCQLSPLELFDRIIDLPSGISFQSLTISVADAADNVLVSFQPEEKTAIEIPEAAQAAKLPHEINSIEQLYHTGIHLEQYRHATFHPADYYKEGLKREPGNSQCNNAMGLLLLRKGQFVQSEFFFRKAIKTLTEKNFNAADGEPWFNLGLCLQMQERFDEAYDAYFKSVWSDAWQHSGFLALARIATRQGKWNAALQFVNQSLARNYNSYTAQHLKITLLRKAGRFNEADSLISESRQLDPFNYGTYYEYYLLLRANKHKKKAAAVLQKAKAIQGNRLQNLLEYALDYATAGLYKDASDFICCFLPETAGSSPLPLYYLGWLAGKEGDVEGSVKYYTEAEKLPADFCFPNKIEEIAIFQDAMRIGTGNPKPYYYLGNLWYDKQQYKEAINCWEQSVKLNSQFPTVYRNLALAYFNKERNPGKALAAMEQAFILDRSDARVLMELDQLYKVVNKPVEQRLNLLEENSHIVDDRDDLYLERIALFNLSGRYEEAKALLLGRKFHPWEGGEGKVPEQYLFCITELAKLAIRDGRAAAALSFLSSAHSYPHNFGEGKLHGNPENDLAYLSACAYQLLGRDEEAAVFFEKATHGSPEPVQAIFYNDPQPDKIFYQGLAWYKLGFFEKAESVFRKLISFGRDHLESEVRIDYFAVSLPDLLVFDQDLQQRNKAHCYYLQALGHLGLGEFEMAEAFFLKVKEIQYYHTGAHIHSLLKGFLQFVGGIPVVGTIK